ncbi:MAG: hypothetical protein AAFR12_20375 [Cyanobacteria bacterium J06626_6]
MLAYTTVSDLFYLPTVFEATVYIGGLLFVLACPYLFLWAIDKRQSAKQTAQSNRQKPQQQNS